MQGVNKLTEQQKQDHYDLGNLILNIFKLLNSEYGLRRLFSLFCIAMKDEPVNKSNEGLIKLFSSLMMFNDPRMGPMMFQNVEFQKKAFILPFAAVYETATKYLIIKNKDGSYERDAEGKVYVSEDPTNWFNFFKESSNLLVETFKLNLNIDESSEFLSKQFLETILKECPKLLKEIKNFIGLLCDGDWSI